MAVCNNIACYGYPYSAVMIRLSCFCVSKIFLARETPIDSLVFVVRACGGVVGWQGEESPFAMDEAVSKNKPVYI